MKIRKILWPLTALLLTIGSLLLGGLIGVIICIVIVLAIQAIIHKKSHKQS